MATIRNAGASSITAGFGAITSTFNAVGAAAGMADDYISGAAASARVYRARAEADAEAKMMIADRNAQDKAIAWLVNQEREIQDQLSNNQDRERFNQLKSEIFGK